MKLKSLEDLYVDELKDLYSAENQIVKALPRLVKAAGSEDLKMAFKDHLKQTEGHVQRLEKIFTGLEAKPRGKKCMGMEGLLEEGKELLAEEAEENVLDAGLIGAAQKVEHYEIAAYGTARAHAHQLGFTRDAELLQQTLNEESAANEKLTQIAESFVNWRADNGHQPVMMKAQ